MTRAIGSREVLAFIILLALALAGCAGPPLPHLDSMSALSSGETVIVGKMELVPPLEDGEQRMETVSSIGGVLMINPYANELKNAVYLLTDEKSRNIGEPAISDYTNRIEAKLGEPFYVRAKRAPLHVNAAEIMMSIERYGTNKVRLPAKFMVDIKPGDRAVYIGTVRYHRDEFFEITRVEVVDDYAKERAAFNKRFGNGLTLKKALVKASSRR